MAAIDRIYEFVSYKDISISEFSINIGVSNGYLAKQKSASANIGSHIIEKLVSAYPEINADWLITGRGVMLYEYTDKHGNLNGNPNGNLNPALPPESGKTKSTKTGKDKVSFEPFFVSDSGKTNSIKTDKNLVISEERPKFYELKEMPDAVPFYDLPVSAGDLGVLNGWENYEPSGYVKLEAFRGCERIFPVTGVSMEPIVHSGDLIGIKSIEGLSRNWNFLQTGVIYLIITHEERMIKYIEEAGDNDYIICSSPNYKPFRVHKADILELYRVKAVARGL